MATYIYVLLLPLYSRLISYDIFTAR